MRFDILTLFPELFDSPLKASILGRACEAGLITTHLHNIRDWADDKHHVTDDAPYGGGGGMVMKPEPVVRSIRAVRDVARAEAGEAPVIYLSPQGELLTAKIVDEIAALPGVILLCGNYEGIDERAIEMEVDREISIGDYVLTGGELPALVLLNAVARKIPGVLGNADSAANDSFESGLLDFPHYTRPEVFEDRPVPEILRGGNHAKVNQWRREQSLRRTAERRPDLIEKAELSKQDRTFLKEREDENQNAGHDELADLGFAINELDATILPGLLESAGIPCFLANDFTRPNIIGPVDLGVRVRSGDLVRAREIVRDYFDRTK